MNLNKLLSRSLYYDMDGSPITMQQWCEKFEDIAYRRIGKTRVGPFQISTVWLGLDHALGMGRPLIFETIVFPDCEEMYRYHTLEDAKAGHEHIVAEYRARVSQNVSHLKGRKN